MKNNKNTIYLEHLPRRGSGNYINWTQSVGYNVPFNYKNIDYTAEIVEFISPYIKIKINQDNKIYTMDISTFVKCRFGGVVGTHTKNFKFNINDTIQGDGFNFTILDMEYRDYKKTKYYKMYKLRCNVCGYDDIWRDEYRLSGKHGCPVCSGDITVANINSLSVTTPWMMDFLVNKEDAYKYSEKSSKRVQVKCVHCGKIQKNYSTLSNLYLNKSVGCDCGDNKSFPEKFFISILKQLNIEFETEFAPKWCRFILNNKEKRGRYDFYFKINDIDYIVETDGIQHKTNVFNGKKSLYINIIDNKKDELAKLNNINVIRIDCCIIEKNYIKQNIIDSELKNILDLNNINWDLCEEYALKNLIKEVCEFKTKNQSVSNKDISKIFNIGLSSVRNYLIRGERSGYYQKIKNSGGQNSEES